MAHYLVTGGAGFVGVNLVKRLLERGEQVRVLDNLSTGRYENLAPYINAVDFIEGDIRSYHHVQAAVRNVDYVLHQAALPSVPRSVKDPLSSNEANVQGTLNLLYAAADAGVQRFVYASSSSIYGDSEVLPKHEDLCPNPKSPYAISKLSGEYYCRVFYKLYGLETVALRYFNVFGPRQNPNSQYAAVIPKFLRALKQGQPPTIFGDGYQSRDFTFVDNNVSANLLACTQPGVGGEVFNIACGAAFTLLDLVNELNDILGSQIEPSFLAPRPGDVKHSQAAIDRARQHLGFEPNVGFREGLERLAASFDE
jgi:UDP-glucose 4-epimerase